MSKSWVKIWPHGLDYRRPPVGGQHVPVESETNSSNRTLIPCKLPEICPCAFGILPSFKVNRSEYIFFSHVLKPFICRSQGTILTLFREVPNFVTYALWPHFLGQGQGPDTILTFFSPPRQASYLHGKISIPAPWADFVTHIHKRAHHPITARALFNSRSRIVLLAALVGTFRWRTRPYLTDRDESSNGAFQLKREPPRKHYPVDLLPATCELVHYCTERRRRGVSSSNSSIVVGHRQLCRINQTVYVQHDESALALNSETHHVN